MRIKPEILENLPIMEEDNLVKIEKLPEKKEEILNIWKKETIIMETEIENLEELFPEDEYSIQKINFTDNN